MSRVTMIQHINIQISDKERARDWYEKVLGGEYLDRGPELNQGQLQLRIGSGEIHSTLTPTPNPSGHFALEVHDWEEMIANLDALEVAYSPPTIRAYSGGHSTYIKDPDGNMIELVQHPLGLRDSKGETVKVVHDPEGMRWPKAPVSALSADAVSFSCCHQATGSVRDVPVELLTNGPSTSSGPTDLSATVRPRRPTYLPGFGDDTRNNP